MTYVKRIFMKRHTKACWLAILREIAAAVVIHASVFPRDFAFFVLLLMFEAAGLGCCCWRCGGQTHN